MGKQRPYKEYPEAFSGVPTFPAPSHASMKTAASEDDACLC